MRRQEGFLLVTVLFVTVVLVLLAIGTSATSLIDRQVAARQRGGTEAYYLAQAGMERLKTAVFQALSAAARTTDVCGPPDFDIDLGGGETLAPGGLSRAFRLSADQNGWYRLQFIRSGPYYALTAIGYLGTSANAAQRSAQSTVQLVAAAGPGISGVWDNAIFTPSLSRRGGGDLTGTIAAYGSVHIVNGDIELDSGESESLAASGSSGVFNNYRGRATGTQTDVRSAAELALGALRTNAEGLDLCSRLKVAQGNVRVQSNAVGIGAEGDQYNDDDWVAMDPVRRQVQSIEGIYLGTGSVVDQSGQPVPASPDSGLYTRSGIAGYEGFEELRFPPLPVGFPAASSVVASCDLVVGGVLQLPPLATGTVSCSSADGLSSITWNEDLQRLQLNGRVSFPDADLVFAQRPESGVAGSVLQFEGSGEIQIGQKSATGTSGRVDINMRILPADPSRNYKRDEVVGGVSVSGSGLAVTTAGNIEVRHITGSDAVLAALLYAEGQANFRQQVSVVGAVVAGSVDVEQVPAFLYHPDIADFAESRCLEGTECALGEAGNKGAWSEVSTEVRD